MSLRDKYKTDSETAREGVWFDFDTNPDGTKPAFKLAIAGKQNKNYIAAMRKWTSAFEDEAGVPDLAALSEEEADRYLLEVFADTVLLDWRNFQPDEDGVALPFSRDNVIKIFGSDDWHALYSALNAKARKATNFRKKVLAAQTKN